MVKGKPSCLWPEFPRWRESELQRVIREEAKPKDLAGLSLREQAANTRIIEIKLAEIEGEMLPIGDVKDQLEKICLVLRAKVLAFPGKWAHKVVGLKTLPVAQSVLDDVAREVLGALSVAGSDPSLDEEAA